MCLGICVSADGLSRFSFTSVLTKKHLLRYFCVIDRMMDRKYV